MTAPFFFQPVTDFNAVLIWAEFNSGMTSEYRAVTGRSRRKPLRQGETKINPVQHHRADEERSQRGGNRPALNGCQPAPIEKAVRSPNTKPKHNAKVRQERQRVPPHCAGKVETGTSLETARAATEGTRNACQSLQATERQRKVPLHGNAGGRQQQQQSDESQDRSGNARPFLQR